MKYSLAATSRPSDVGSTSAGIKTIPLLSRRNSLIKLLLENNCLIVLSILEYCWLLNTQGTKRIAHPDRLVFDLQLEYVILALKSSALINAASFREMLYILFVALIIAS